MSETTAIRTGSNLAARRITMAGARRAAGSRGYAAGTWPRAVATTRRWPGSAATGTARTSSEPPPSASIARSGGGQLVAEVAALPGDQAGRPARGAGRPSSTRSARPATARAVTAGHRPRWRRSAASASARTGAASTVASRPAAATAADRKRAFLATGSSSSARAAGSATASGRPGIAAARPEVDEAVDAAVAQDGDRAEAVDDVGGRDRRRVADRGQVDGGRPGQQQPGVAVDRLPGARRRRSGRGRPARPRARRRTPAGAAECPRRASGAARAVGPRHASCGSRAIRRAAPLPASTSVRTAGAASVFRGPSGSWPGFPEPLANRVTLASAPVRMPDGKGRDRSVVNGVFHEPAAAGRIRG